MRQHISTIISGLGFISGYSFLLYKGYITLKEIKNKP